MSEKKPRVKNPKRVAAGRKGGKMSRARNRTAIQAVRKKMTFELRLTGMTFEEIGKRLKPPLSKPGVIALYKQALGEYLGESKEMAEAVREKQMVKLSLTEDRLFVMIQAKGLRVREVTENGDVVELADFEALQKLNAALVKNYEQQAKLVGAYAPAKVEVAGAKPLTEEELLARLAREGGA